ncbi:MAG: hypothetical protein A2201_10080 [Alicyclobacillus sp. RIFOXYA1_FULL_53_8]|nr:MAG: hypothetical protein A2201_10080 [Alicyclobacillus sp. RIFOXYA1_FULL_53_8]
MNGHWYYELIGATAVATYLTRFPSLFFSRFLRITPRLKQGLSYIPIGVFAAMVAPSIVLHHGSGPNPVIDWPFFAATGIAMVVAIFTKNPLWTMLSGVLAIAGLRLL